MPVILLILGGDSQVFLDAEVVNLVQMEYAELGDFLSSYVPVFSDADLYDGEPEGFKAEE
ncbi:MAG: hypothetical protein ACYSYV_00655 [Planctomycetota bacterium]|jgi:hypothetical protein